MASSSRKLFNINILLVLLIGGMFWFMINGGSTDFLTFGKKATDVKKTSSTNATIPAQGLTTKDAQAIEALKKQLDAEKSRIATARAQLQTRSENQLTPPGKAAPAADSEAIEGMKVE
jgi:hypothetical protein